ncbi:unnamed protein product [Prunus armeniaca]|uniref:Uncharacterized protein n=1 Tax=Prunus armeniaca TaxID=36596 RepID=A0A6J5TSB9_PRUAR|nr:unnamed protein product [Prunus armeniaca]
MTWHGEDSLGNPKFGLLKPSSMNVENVIGRERERERERRGGGGGGSREWVGEVGLGVESSIRLGNGGERRVGCGWGWGGGRVWVAARADGREGNEGEGEGWL